MLHLRRAALSAWRFGNNFPGRLSAVHFYRRPGKYSIDVSDEAALEPEAEVASRSLYLPEPPTSIILLSSRLPSRERHTSLPGLDVLAKEAGIVMDEIKTIDEIHDKGGMVRFS